MKEEVKQAIDILTNALDKANRAGAFGMMESENNVRALRFIAEQFKEEPKEEKPKK